MTQGCKTAGAKLPPGELLAKTMAALKNAPPLGLEIAQVAAITGSSRGTAKTTLSRLANRGQCWRITLPGRLAAYYFPTEAACEAARAEVEARHKALWAEKHEAARLRQRARERARDGRDPNAPVLPRGQTCSEFLVDYLKAALPDGVSLASAKEACGKSYHSVKKSMGTMVQDGRAWSISLPGWALYFGTEAARDAARGTVEPRPVVKPPKAAKPPKKQRVERQPRYEFRRADLDAQPKKVKPPMQIDWSRAKRTEAESNPRLGNRWHSDTVPSLFGAMGIGRYLKTEVGQ